MGRGEASKLLHIIDFGLSKRYKDLKSGKHISLKKGQKFIGSAKYASINAHIGVEQSKRDDLESICYVIAYFLKGRLPWQEILEENEEVKYKKIADCKNEQTPEILFKGQPGRYCIKCLEELVALNAYCKNLKFEEEPNYGYIHELLMKVLMKEKLECDLKFDWMLKESLSNTKFPSLVTEENKSFKYFI